jgi:hypothetical protein
MDQIIYVVIALVMLLGAFSVVKWVIKKTIWAAIFTVISLASGGGFIYVKYFDGKLPLPW